VSDMVKMLLASAEKADDNYPEMYCVPPDLARAAAKELRRSLTEIKRLQAQVAKLREAQDAFQVAILNKLGASDAPR